MPEGAAKLVVWGIVLYYVEFPLLIESRRHPSVQQVHPQRRGVEGPTKFKSDVVKASKKPRLYLFDAREPNSEKPAPWAESPSTLHGATLADNQTSSDEPLTVVNGGWSEWSPWSECQITCGAGIKLSNRWCDKPAPQNGGKDCDGDPTRKEPCFVKTHCPVNGGWSDWAPWACSATCGGGIASRNRTCTKPKPLYGGKCIGNSTDLWKIPCNLFTCPPVRKVSEETKKLLEEVKKDFFVRTNIIPEGTAVTKVQCGSKQLLDNLLWELKLNIRHAIQWMRNGEPWKEDKSRIEKSKFALGFKRVAASDTGFYSCELDLLGGGKKILKAFSLIVTSNRTTMEVEVNKPYELECNTLTLGELYPNCRISWYFNDILFRSFNDTPAVLKNSLKFEHAAANMSGDWECVTYEIRVTAQKEKIEKGLLSKVKDNILGKKEEDGKSRSGIMSPILKYISTPSPVPAIVPGHIWITNKLRLRVKPPKGLGDLIRTPQFMGLCAGVILLALIVIIGIIKGKSSEVMENAEEKAQYFAKLKRTSNAGLETS